MKINANNVRNYVHQNFKTEHGTFLNAFKKLTNIKMPFDEFSISVDEIREEGGDGTVIMYFKKTKEGHTVDEYIVDLVVDRKDYKDDVVRSKFLVKKDGRPYIKGDGEDVSIFDMQVNHNYIKRKQEAFDIAQTFLYVALLTIQFMHCNNVTLVENSKPLSRNKAKNKKKIPQIRYYTLDIEPIKEILKREGSIEKNGIQKALHICRGHFKDFTEKGLFGKIKGVFWVPAHEKGKSENGVVVKDYNVKVNKTE
jgi:hypothetical protein